MPRPSRTRVELQALEIRFHDVEFPTAILGLVFIEVIGLPPKGGGPWVERFHAYLLAENFRYPHSNP